MTSPQYVILTNRASMAAKGIQLRCDQPGQRSPEIDIDHTWIAPVSLQDYRTTAGPMSW